MPVEVDLTKGQDHLDGALRDDVEDAAGVWPLQAILVRD
jgi:hypothetical protein